jgi:uncharacterized repeat protein (TIGR01451 family)
MRRALWIFSAPVVAGGLAWAVNAADTESPLLAGAPQAQNGQIFYFSRGANSGSVASAQNAADASADDDADQADGPDTSASPQRYIRNRTASGSSARPAPKNYYQDLFGNPRATQDASAAQQAAARKSATSDVGGARANKRAVADDCDVKDGADCDTGREDVPLPAAGKTELVGGTRESGGVRHADHNVREGSKNSGVKQVQYRSGTTAKRQVPPPADDDADAAAPAPPPAKAARPEATSKTTKTAPAPASRAPAGKPAAGVQAKVAAPVKTVKKAPAAAVPKARQPVTPVAAEVEAVEAPARKAAPIPASDVIVSSVGAGDVPMVSLKWVKNEEVNVGQECTCGLVVKNTGKLAAKDIVVEAYFPRTVRLIDAEPFPSDSRDHLVWVFEHLAPGEERTIQITMIPGRRGDMETSATVRFTGVASAVLTVEEPQLAVAVSGSNEVMVGDSLTQVITVSNPGTGVAHDVVVNVKLPEGLEHPRGKNVEMGIGSLGPNETRELRLPLSAIAGGDALLVVEARGSSNLIQRAQALVKIAAPKLSVEIAGPGLRYVGRHAQFAITVTNDGVAATDNVRVVELVPEGFEFIKADRNGKFDTTSGSVSWFIGHLEAGQSTQVALELAARQIGEYLHHVQASGENGTIATTKLATRVDGASAVVMEVADLDDPVEVGTQTAYEIRIRNDGSKAAHNVRISCDLPAGVELIDTKGPTDPVLEKGVLYFKPIGELAAGAKTSYLIRVNGTVAGNLRMRAKLTSNASPEPLIVEEMTKFYAD